MQPDSPTAFCETSDLPPLPYPLSATASRANKLPESPLKAITDPQS